MIVVDTNVITYSFIAGEQTALAWRVRELDPYWRAPLLWRNEFLNVLTIYVRRDGCDVKKAEEYWGQAVKNLSGCENAVDMPSVLRFSCEHNISAYDAQFMVLSHCLGVACVTEDKQLLKKFPGWAVSMKEFCESVG